MKDGILEKTISNLSPNANNDETSVNPNTGTVDNSSLKARIAKRGRPSEADREASKASKLAEEKKAEAVERLYTAKQWSPIASLYFDTRFVMTGHESFLLNKEQKDELGNSLALIMRDLAVIDPKYVALTVFGVQFSTLLIQKEIAWKAEKANRSKIETKNA